MQMEILKAPDGFEQNYIDKPNHPVVNISWDEASSYCSWAGVELPTEAQMGEGIKRGTESDIPLGKQFRYSH